MAETPSTPSTPLLAAHLNADATKRDGLGGQVQLHHMLDMYERLGSEPTFHCTLWSAVYKYSLTHPGRPSPIKTPDAIPERSMW